MNKTDYWVESLASSFIEHGISASPDQVKNVAEDIQISHENIGLAFYTPENPLLEENRKLKLDLKAERNKSFCEKCKGTGSITENFGPIGRSSTSTCYKCNGVGKL